ncbi:hypothetical protein SDC9_162062 [bioreactor metagenome]|uniref:F5/8 type C domain-containing protein n=1 Tax=bioreactor metagenome TaxID=1076179 RepID=A0A645FK21_9ZZZZ
MVDGIIEAADFKHYSAKRVIWIDKTPNQVPDWIALEFKQPVTVKRIVLYPVENSLKDYQIQLWCDGKWKTVAEADNATGEYHEHRIAAIKTDKIRIWITAVRGAYAKLAEIEIY